MASKFPTRWYYQYWRTWSSIFKVLKVTIFAISSRYVKKEVRDEAHFLHANKHERLNKLALSFYKGSDHTGTKYPKFFVFYCDTKYLDILWGSSHVCSFLCCFCLLWLAMKFKRFPVLKNSKYTEQRDQNNFYCFFLLVII